MIRLWSQLVWSIVKNKLRHVIMKQNIFHMLIFLPQIPSELVWRSCNGCVAAAKTVQSQVSVTAGQTLQTCYALWHEDWNTSKADMTCKDYLRQNNLFLILKKMWKHTYSLGKMTSPVQHCIMCKVAKIQPDPKNCPIRWPKPPLLKITQFLPSALNIFKANHEIFACDCLKHE